MVASSYSAREAGDRSRTSGFPSRFRTSGQRWVPLVGLISLLGWGCSIDIKESVGPLVPVPNLTGQVLSNGVPVIGLRVRLEDASDSTIAGDATDGSGRFEFSQIGKGDWSLRFESESATDFARVTYEFSFVTTDTSLVVPSVDVALRGFEITAPEDLSVEPVPGFFSPLLFTWEDAAARQTQVRFFEADDGEAIWYSTSSATNSARWNGIGTENDYVSVPVTAGQYRWRLRMQETGGLEYLTQYRQITFAP